MGFRELLDWWWCREGGAPQEGVEAPGPSPHTLSMHLFHLAVPEIYPFIIDL